MVNTTFRIYKICDLESEIDPSWDAHTTIYTSENGGNLWVKESGTFVILKTFNVAAKAKLDFITVTSPTNLDTVLSHLSNVSNPHSVTKSQVGLANVDNTSDAAKPVSTAQQAALDGKVDGNVAIT